MRLSLSYPTVSSTRDVQAAEVMASMAPTVTLREVLWYLEDSGWDVESAIQQYRQDEVDRAGAAQDECVSIFCNFP